MTKLKPCPFCGGDAYLQKGHDCIASAVRCKVCEGAIFGHRDEVAVERWNKRENPWHTGTPTEEGWYLLAFKYGDEDSRTFYEVLKWEGVWKDKDIGWDALKVFDLAWMPITPYEEN